MANKNLPLIFIKTTRKSRIEQKPILTSNFKTIYLHGQVIIFKKENNMILSIEGPTLNMYQFGESWSSKIYQTEQGNVECDAGDASNA